MDTKGVERPTSENELKNERIQSRLKLRKQNFKKKHCKTSTQFQDMTCRNTTERGKIKRQDVGLVEDGTTKATPSHP